MDRQRLVLALAVLGLGYWLLQPQPQPQPPPKPQPPAPPARPVNPCPDNRCPRIPRESVEMRVGGNAEFGEEIQIDLPPSEHLRNKGGTDGAGLCVFTSIEHSARWQNERALIGFRDWMAKNHPGGGYPSKVDRLIPLMAKANQAEKPSYMQHVGGDLEFLRLALRTGRMPAVTYDGRDGKYYQSRIAHMVNLVHLSDSSAVILDNNYPGQYLWMTPQEFKTRWDGNGRGWAVVLMAPPPPPIPVNVVKVSPMFTQLTAQALLWGALPQWYTFPAYPEHYFLYQGNQCIGCLHPDTRGFLVRHSDGSYDRTPRVPPIAPPAQAQLNFGIELEKISQEKCYQLNGKEVSREQVFMAFADSHLNDDSHKLRLTVVGDAEFRKQVLLDLQRNPELQSFREKILVQDYPPDHWAVRDVGILPGITIQGAPGSNGKAPVLCRIESYTGPEELAGALRKADPNYRPEKDPKPGDWLQKLREQKELIFAALGALVVLLLTPRGEKK